MTIDAKTQRQIAVTVPLRMYQRLSERANAAKLSTTAYATHLFQAAASERLKPGSAPDLDAAVGRVALLWGERKLNAAEIAKLLGISEATVVRIIDAWKLEIAEVA